MKRILKSTLRVADDVKIMRDLEQVVERILKTVSCYRLFYMFNQSYVKVLVSDMGCWSFFLNFSLRTRFCCIRITYRFPFNYLTSCLAFSHNNCFGDLRQVSLSHRSWFYTIDSYISWKKRLEKCWMSRKWEPHASYVLWVHVIGPPLVSVRLIMFTSKETLNMTSS